MEACDLIAFDLRVDAQRGNLAVFLRDEVVDADYDLLFLFDGTLEVVGGFLDFGLHEAGFDGFEYAAGGADFFDVGESSGFDLVRERFDSVGTCDGVDGVSDACFVSDDLLGAKRDQRGVFGGERQRFVQRIGVQRLAAAENGGEGLDRDSDDVVFRLLRGEGRAGCLRVKAEQQGTRVTRPKTLTHDARPETSRGA